MTRENGNAKCQRKQQMHTQGKHKGRRKSVMAQEGGRTERAAAEPQPHWSWEDTAEDPENSSSHPMSTYQIS
jgi:hypothetical protein